MNYLTEESLAQALSSVKDSMGIMYNDDDKMIENKLKTSATWLCETILYEPNYIIQPNTPELTLVYERVRYEMSNSLDIFQKNYGNDIQNVISRHAYLDFINKDGV